MKVWNTNKIDDIDEKDVDDERNVDMIEWIKMNETKKRRLIEIKEFK